MSIAGLLFASVMTLVALLIVAYPLLSAARGDRAAVNSIQQHRDRLRIQYERILTNIRDLDEDFATGKIGADAYAEERDVWAQRGVELLWAQDQFETVRVDLAIDSAVAAYRDRLDGEPR